MTLEWSAKVERHQSQLRAPSEYICNRSPQDNSRSEAYRSHDIYEEVEFQASSRTPTEISSMSRVHEEASNINPDDRGLYVEYDTLTDEEAVEEPMQVAVSEAHNIEHRSLLDLHERAEFEFEAVLKWTILKSMMMQAV
ncbi:uncharacterized protein PFLUO_LOCUS2777 [Penicillium psychrofluorescens]|uniref:uncharacterized protein n=1 Tax=Penicillium psychrofluorescens TaxID=3158075 RepID=UPI003CCE143D